jgi:CHAT domain-containing protein/Tfp pilus assembly protein PilF
VPRERSEMKSPTKKDLNNGKRLGTHRFQRARFPQRSLIEARDAGSDAHPGAFPKRVVKPGLKRNVDIISKGAIGMIRTHSGSIQGKYRLWVVNCGLMLSIVLPFIQVQASPNALYVGKKVKPYAGIVSPAQGTRQTQQLEPGNPIERELAGGQSHSYQMTLAAGQYINLMVDQRGIDVAVKLSGPDGKQIIHFDFEIRTQGREIVEWVAEEAGSYRLDVTAKYESAAAGGYEIQAMELRLATENDRALHEARKLSSEFRRRYFRGRYDEVLPLVARALEIRERVLGPEHQDVAQTLNNLAVLYGDRGDYAKAELIYQRALAISEKTLGPEHPDVAATLTNLAALYTNTGDYAKAELLYQRALTITEKTRGPEHPDVGTNLAKLAALYLIMGDYTKAEPLFQRALIIKEKALGPEHPDVAATLTNLAALYTNTGDYLKAEQLYGRALAIREKALGPEHPDVSANLANLAALYLRMGDYAKAEPLYRRALIIWEKVLGPEHPNIAGTLNDLAALYAAKGEIDQAVTFLSRANAVDERNLALNLGIGSGRQKLAYLSLFSKRSDFTLSLQSQAAPTDLQALNLAFTTILRRKSRGLDAMADTIATLRRHATPEDQKLLAKLTEARSRLAALTLKGPDAANPGAYRTRVKLLEAEIDELERELSSRSLEFRRQSQPVTLAAVQVALPAGSALVEFVFHTPLEPQTEKRNPPRYLAYLLTAQGQPKWVDLGEAALIDQAIDAWRKALGNPNQIDVKQHARAVDERVMQPVRSLLDQMPGEKRRLLIAPDGSLNLIPFGALVDEQDQYLIERYSISYLTSGRDLLRLQRSEPSKDAPLVVANPDFGRVTSITTRGAQISRISRTRNQAQGQRGQTDPRQVYFRPLPGTEDEALAIKTLLPKASVLRRELATETALKQARGPQILHIATHGFFINDQGSPTGETRGFYSGEPLRIPDRPLNKWAAYIKNPLLRSGLGLAGVNQNKSGDDDGVLTALEAAGLDLSGTKLVVLSAGNTGVGEVKNGEGVQGLRRALVLAGSESQVISLWPVSDVATKDLMISYYKALQLGDGRSEGLRQAQLRMLRGRKDRRHPFYWAAFIQSGEWANLDGQR